MYWNLIDFDKWIVSGAKGCSALADQKVSNLKGNGKGKRETFSDNFSFVVAKCISEIAIFPVKLLLYDDLTAAATVVAVVAVESGGWIFLIKKVER